MTFNVFSITSLPDFGGIQLYSLLVWQITLLFIAVLCDKSTNVQIFPRVDGILDVILPSHPVLRETRGEAYKAEWQLPFWRARNKRSKRSLSASTRKGSVYSAPSYIFQWRDLTDGTVWSLEVFRVCPRRAGSRAGGALSPAFPNHIS